MLKNVSDSSVILDLKGPEANNGAESTTDDHHCEVEKDDYADLSDEIYIEPGVYVSSGFDRKRGSEAEKTGQNESDHKKSNNHKYHVKNYGLSFFILNKN